MRLALAGQAGSTVPCGGCTACCTSAQFVHVGPEETDTLAHIPPALLFPAPRLPRGHVVLGYDERGHCPMLRDGRCSIYPHRPRACRTYDCRVFPAAGTEPRSASQAQISSRAARWRFAYPTEADRTRHEAVRAAARFLATHADLVEHGTSPPDATRVALLALEVHHLFLGFDEVAGRVKVVKPDPAAVRAEIGRRGGR
jgi:Fe-S-cluster containining protein